MTKAQVDQYWIDQENNSDLVIAQPVQDLTEEWAAAGTWE